MSDDSIDYVSVLEGALAIGHRPKLKKISTLKEGGATHIWTLLSEREGALDIGKATKKSDLQWQWLPLANGKPPEDSALTLIETSFAECKAALEEGARIYLHCSAGIHRTGMMSYAFLRYLNFDETEALETVKKMRTLTREGVGSERLAWGDAHFGSKA
ncbi:MAG: protein-tyrosine phosphatase family protein [Cellvibrionaceae bacterium]